MQSPPLMQAVNSIFGFLQIRIVFNKKTNRYLTYSEYQTKILNRLFLPIQDFAAAPVFFYL